MKRLSIASLVSLSFGFFVACQGLMEPSADTAVIEQQLAFTASREFVSPVTKSLQQEDGSVWWGPNEEISVFCDAVGDGGSMFVSQNSEEAETVEFEGYLQIEDDENMFWAAYPYSEENEFDGSSITMVIPSRQIGVEDNFSGNTFPAIARSQSSNLLFWNVCGGIKFSVSRDDIRSISIKGNNDEPFSGKVRFGFGDDGKPVILEIPEPCTEVVLRAPDYGTFAPGCYYYMSILPTELPDGITLTFRTLSERGVVTSWNPQTVKRSVFGVLENVDENVLEWESLVSIPEAVDLGLSVKWAKWNVGATRPEEFGDYFAWGEVEPYYEEGYAQSDYPVWKPGKEAGYDGPSYRWWNGSEYDYAKYNSEDNLIELERGESEGESIDDTARANWGFPWRMATQEEWEELQDTNNCSWDWTTENGVSGYRITSKKEGYTDRSIFLPAACSRFYTDIYPFVNEERYGDYWYSSPIWGHHLFFLPNQINTARSPRYLGFSIRPVEGTKVYSVSLNYVKVALYEGESVTLEASILPKTASDKTITWSSSNPEVAAVDQDGLVIAVKEGEASITVTTRDGEKSAACKVTVKSKIPPEPEAVDLGLSVKWATFNIGARAPEEYGDYFAWGETEPYYENGFISETMPLWKAGKEAGYSWKSYKWCNGTEESITKYNSEDNKTELERGEKDGETIDDVARALWGGEWRIPIEAEFRELTDPDNCEWTWTYENGVRGYRITSKIDGYTDKSIFLPDTDQWELTYQKSGYDGAFYWTSSLDREYPQSSFNLFFYRNGISIYRASRCYGFSVRPVYGPRSVVHVTSILLNLSSVTLYEGHSISMDATVLPVTADNKTVNWSSSNPAVAGVDQNGLIVAISPGEAEVSVLADDNGVSAVCSVHVEAIPIDDYVDLGLSVKWANWNVGASAPWESGDSFAWGETEPYYQDGYALSDDPLWKSGKEAGYSWESYRWCDGTGESITKYNTEDNKTELERGEKDGETIDDVARSKWGEQWRMPSMEEWEELLNPENCSWEWVDGENGYKITSKKNGYAGRFIFLPLVKYRDGTGSLSDIVLYWSSSLYSEFPVSACSVFGGSWYTEGMLVNCSRYMGLSVRPVRD